MIAKWLATGVLEYVAWNHRTAACQSARPADRPGLRGALVPPASTPCPAARESLRPAGCAPLGSRPP